VVNEPVLAQHQAQSESAETESTAASEHSSNCRSAKTVPKYEQIAANVEWAVKKISKFYGSPELETLFEKLCSELHIPPSFIVQAIEHSREALNS
jgi:hypothetical protein